MTNPSIAVLIPCYNESKTIANVIREFKQVLPYALIHVYDNGSQDNSPAIAREAGAEVKSVPDRGKGQVVRRQFAEIDADIYVMIDGDATYNVSYAEEAIRLLQEDNLDMVVCTRKPCNTKSFRPGHQFGNKCFNTTIKILFGHECKDIFSGYRVFSRRFVKSFPVVSQGFDIEAEITIHALQLGVPVAEIETPYIERPPGSMSKLRTIQDGLRILQTILLLFMYMRPLTLFGGLFLIFVITSLVLGIPVIIEFIHTGLVPRMPTAVLAASFGILAAVSLACGIVLDSISRARLEAKRFWYLLRASI